MQVFGLWEEAAVPLREPPQKQGGDSIKTELPYFSLELATLSLRLRLRPAVVALIVLMAGSPVFASALSPRPSRRCCKTRPQVLAGGVVSLRHRYLKCSVLKSSQGPGSQYITGERQR